MDIQISVNKSGYVNLGYKTFHNLELKDNQVMAKFYDITQNNPYDDIGVDVRIMNVDTIATLRKELDAQQQYMEYLAKEVRRTRLITPGGSVILPSWLAER